MNASLSRYIPGVGHVAPHPVGDLPLDPPTDNTDERVRFEESRWDNEENLFDDFNAGIEAIFGDQAKMDDLAECLRTGDTCHLGHMIRNAALQAREDYVGDNFDELQAKSKWGSES